MTCAAECAEKQHKKGILVTCDTYVTMSDGTGIVHIAPAFGEDDAQGWKKVRPSICTVRRRKG